MDCLKGYIGYRPALAYEKEESPAPASTVFSGLYVNSLPGLSYEVVRGILDGDEHVDEAGLWAEVELRALKKFALSVKGELNKCHRIVDSGVVACLACDNKDALVVALWYFLGVELMIERTSSDRLNRYTTIDLDKAERLKGEYYTEFERSLSDAIGSLNIANSDCVPGCVEHAGGLARWVEQLP